VVAALGGAALRDVLEVTARRAPGVHILVAPAPAQGERSPEENIRALAWISDPLFGCDAVLLVRGGGSIEDLWGYNDPALVRAVAACPLPVITGVGHEIDTTLVDLAADRRAATPSQAAELATPDLAQLKAELRRRVEALSDRMAWRLRGLESTLNLLVDSAGMRALPERLARLQGRRETLHARLVGAHPARRLDLGAQRFVHLRARLLRAVAPATGEADRPRLLMAERRLLPATEKRLAASGQRLALLGAKLAGLDPKGPLARGFVLVKDASGQPLTSAAQASVGSAVALQWLDGERKARIEG
jgi:exodeoxyribonuclease VII large subunit